MGEDEEVYFAAAAASFGFTSWSSATASRRSTRTRDIGVEQVGVRKQAGGHERAVAVAVHRHAGAVADAQFCDRVDRRLRVEHIRMIVAADRRDTS